MGRKAFRLLPDRSYFGIVTPGHVVDGWRGFFFVSQRLSFGTGYLSTFTIKLGRLTRVGMNKRQPPEAEDIAQICLNGHVLSGSVTRYPQFRKNFCKDCGAAAMEACQGCDWPIEGISEHAWMADRGPYCPPRYCENCGKPFPWTETALKAAKDYTDEIGPLSTTEKDELKATFDDLSRDTPRTPLAASKFKRLLRAGAKITAIALSFLFHNLASLIR